MTGGTTWYLHGDNNSLLYEKELKANGVTENRHYLQAAGMTFAMVVTRTGSGINSAAAEPTKRPSQVSYYQQDHLGSMAAIADENGAVIERLAYDPWGKRRYPNGLPDKADALVGINTVPGYTLHEHLDEVGVIHMNGRVFDPLIAGSASCPCDSLRSLRPARAGTCTHRCGQCRVHANERTEKRFGATCPYLFDRTRYAAKSGHLWMVASSLWSAFLAMAVS